MMIARRSVAWLIVAGLAVGAPTVACGGGDEGPTTTSSAKREGPSKPQFVRRVNARCAQLRHQLLGSKFKAYKREQERALQAGTQPPSAASFYEDTVAPGMRRLIRQIRALPPPQGDEDRVKAILRAADSAVGQLEADPASVVNVRPPFVVELQNRTLDRADVLAGEYGLDKCSPPNRP